MDSKGLQLHSPGVDRGADTILEQSAWPLLSMLSLFPVHHWTAKAFNHVHLVWIEVQIESWDSVLILEQSVWPRLASEDAACSQHDFGQHRSSIVFTWCG